MISSLIIGIHPPIYADKYGNIPKKLKEPIPVLFAFEVLK